MLWHISLFFFPENWELLEMNNVVIVPSKWIRDTSSEDVNNSTDKLQH